MQSKYSTLGGLPAIEIVDDDGYKSVWQKRSRYWTPIKRSHKGKSIKLLPDTVFRKHLAEVRKIEKKEPNTKTKQAPSRWSKRLVPAAKGFAKQHPQD